jgi:hypothetical protein
MTKYTVRVCDILKSFSYPNTNVRFDEIIKNGKEIFFDFEFPWYSEENVGLDEFKTLFLETYYMHQIGFETYEIFQLNLSKTLKAVMNVYAEKYKIVSKNIDYLSTHNIVDKEVTQDNSVSTSTTNGATISRGKTDTQDINSDNPNITIQTQDYASTMSRGESESSNEVTVNNKTVSDNANSGDRVKTTIGYAGVSPAKLVAEFKENIININTEIVKECEKLFIGLW